METPQKIINGLHRLWWVPLTTGIISIIFGIWCVCSPLSSLPVFAYIFSALVIVAGLLNLIYAFMNQHIGTNWGWSMALGILEIICGVWLLFLPEAALTATFIFVIGIWILCVAINSVCEAAVMSAYSPAWLVWMVLLLIASIVFAVYFLANPVLGGVAVWLSLGFSLLFFGGYRIVLAFQIRSLNRRAS